MVDCCVRNEISVFHKPAAKLQKILHTCKFICENVHKNAELFADFKKMQYFCSRF